jgi:NAD(P)H-hydrate epimerase
MASLAASAAAAAAAEVTHLTQRDAVEIDEQLMGPLGFSVDQLMVSQLLFFPRLLRGGSGG